MADTYQLSLSKIGSGYDPEDFELVLERTAGTECDEIAANWLSETYWVPQIQNGMVVAWNTETIQESVRVPCTVCVKPKITPIEIDCIEAWCVTDEKYCYCDSTKFPIDCHTGEWPALYDPPHAPNGFLVRGLSFDDSLLYDPSGSQLDACWYQIFSELFAWANDYVSNGVALAYSPARSPYWESQVFVDYDREICEPTTPGDDTYSFYLQVRYNPCGSRPLEPPDGPNYGETEKGIITVGLWASSGNSVVHFFTWPASPWSYILHNFGDDYPVNLYEQQTATRFDRFNSGANANLPDYISSDPWDVVPAQITIEPAA